MSWLCSVFKRDSQTNFFSGVCRLHLTATKPKIGEDAARQSSVQYPEVFSDPDPIPHSTSLKNMSGVVLKSNYSNLQARKRK